MATAKTTVKKIRYVHNRTPARDARAKLRSFFGKLLLVVVIIAALIGFSLVWVYFDSQPRYSVAITREQWQAQKIDDYFEITYVSEDRQTGTLTLSHAGHEFTYQCHENRGLLLNTEKYPCEAQFFNGAKTFATYIFALHADEIGALIQECPNLTGVLTNFGVFFNYNSTDAAPLQAFLDQLFQIKDLAALYQVALYAHEHLTASRSNDFYVAHLSISRAALEANDGVFVFGHHQFTTQYGLTSVDLFRLYQENTTFWKKVLTLLTMCDTIK